MRRQSVIRLGIALCLSVYVGGLPKSTQAQNLARRSQPKIIVYKPPGETESLVGIMGQVSRPGTYQFTSAPTLQRILDSAGGLTDNASPMIRVVRGHRVVERVALHAAAQNVLQPGDLVIADAMPRRGGQPAGQRNSGVQLAFLDVIDRPVIVTVEASKARADLIVQMLGQSPELLRTVRVIPPPNQDYESKSPGMPRTLPLLTDGTVLLFDRRQIAQAEVRDMPEIIPCSLPEPDIGGYGVRNAYEERQAREAAVSGPSHRSNSRETSVEAGTLSQVPPPTLDDFSVPSPTLLPDQRIPVALSSSGAAGTGGAAVSTLPFSGTSTISSRASRSTELVHPQPANSAADTEEPAWNQIPGESAQPALDEIDAELDGEMPAKARSFSLWQMMGVITCAGLLVGVALAIRTFTNHEAETGRGPLQRSASPLTEYRRAELPRASVPVPHLPMQAFGIPAQTADTLARQTLGDSSELRHEQFARMVNGELSQIEEPLALPPGLLWSANEKGEILRRMPAQPTGQPSKAIPARPAAASIRQIDPPHHQRVPVPHQRSGNEAPVERALRQLQGDLS